MGDLIKTTDTSGVVTEHHYDIRGNLAKIHLPDGEWLNFTYDSRNRLVKAGDTLYEYDGENNRIAVTEGGKRYGYVVDSNYSLSRVLAKIDPEGEITWYTYGKGLIGQENESGYLTYHFDKRGSMSSTHR